MTPNDLAAEIAFQHKRHLRRQSVKAGNLARFCAHWFLIAAWLYAAAIVGLLAWVTWTGGR